MDTYRDYQGYYYETNGKTFAGKEFNQYAPELEKVQIKEGNNRRFNPLLTNAATFIYGKISKFKIDSSKSIPYYFNPDTTDNVFRYFAKKTNENIIKEINKDNFNLIKNNPLYISISLYYQSNFNENELNEAEKKMPGIKEYINTTYAPGVTD